jgi:hypothetical protein
MSIQNYLRPLWSNGPHVVHDASSTVRTAFELLFKGKPRRQTESIVQLHRVRPLDVTVAWLEIEVSIPVEGTGLSYRRARYLHAFALAGPGLEELTVRRARALFEDVYGEDLIAGVHAVQSSLIGLEHPARVDRAQALFVGGPRQPLPIRPNRFVEHRDADGGRVEIARTHPDAGGRPPSAVSVGDTPLVATVATVATVAEVAQPLEVAETGPVPSIFRDADLLSPVVEARSTRNRPTPVEAFDRALASGALAAVDRRPAASTVEPRSIDAGLDEPAEAVAPSGESASLSMLLRARLVQRTLEDEPKQPESSAAR